MLYIKTIKSLIQYMRLSVYTLVAIPKLSIKFSAFLGLTNMACIFTIFLSLWWDPFIAKIHIEWVRFDEPLFYFGILAIVFSCMALGSFSVGAGAHPNMFHQTIFLCANIVNSMLVLPIFSYWCRVVGNVLKRTDVLLDCPFVTLWRVYPIEELREYAQKIAYDTFHLNDMVGFDARLLEGMLKNVHTKQHTLKAVADYHDELVSRLVLPLPPTFWTELYNIGMSLVTSPVFWFTIAITVVMLGEYITIKIPRRSFQGPGRPPVSDASGDSVYYSRGIPSSGFRSPGGPSSSVNDPDFDIINMGSLLDLSDSDSDSDIINIGDLFDDIP